MENHPIPQDVTGFKFKLIGSVTVKQFLYILAGGILAAVCFMIPVSPIIKLPFSVLFGGIGVMLAFIPIEGRPMDVMIKNFAKALPAENQYIFRKKGADVLVNEYFQAPTMTVAKPIEKSESKETNLDSKRALLYGALKKSYRPDAQEQERLSTINSYLNDTAQPVTVPVQRVDEMPREQRATQIAQPTVIPQANISEAIKVVTPAAPMETPTTKPSPPIQAADPTPAPQFVAPQAPNPMKVEAPRVVQEAQAPIETAASPMTTVPAAPNTNQSVSPNESSSVSSVTPQASLKAGFPSLPDTPNVVMGIIKDPRGRIIPNILVEIMDPQGIPVRAFKTNALGQFAAATPLPNGEYNVLLEDPRKQNEFEQIHIVLDGNIFEPLEIISVDQREKLRRELFGGTGGQQATQ